MDAKNPWKAHLWRAAKAPGNLIVGAAALAASAILVNPLPLILYGLGQPVWLYHGTTSGRYAKQIEAEWKAAAEARTAEELAWLRDGIRSLVARSPSGVWIREGRIPDYLGQYDRLTEIRDQIASRVASRDDVAKALEEDIVAQMDGMLRAYLRMTRERLLFLCSLAGVYPEFDEAPPARTKAPSRLRRLFFTEAEEEPVAADGARARFVTLEARLDDLQRKIDEMENDIADQPENREVYQPNIDMYRKLMAELRERGKKDQWMTAQLKTFPGTFEYILSRMASAQTDVSDIVGDMKLLIEQTDDTVRFAEEMRSSESSTVRRAQAASRVMH